MGHVACAVDLNLYSEKALDWATRLAREFKAVLSLIHVVPRLDSSGEEHYSYEYHRKTAEAANRRIAQMQSRLGTNAEVLLEAGKVARAVCAAVDRVHADLLVIGRGLIEHPPTNWRLSITNAGKSRRHWTFLRCSAA